MPHASFAPSVATICLLLSACSPTGDGTDFDTQGLAQDICASAVARNSGQPEDGITALFVRQDTSGNRYFAVSTQGQAIECVLDDSLAIVSLSPL